VLWRPVHISQMGCGVGSVLNVNTCRAKLCGGEQACAPLGHSFIFVYVASLPVCLRSDKTNVMFTCRALNVVVVLVYVQCESL